jgi:integrase/recombinase XerD
VPYVPAHHGDADARRWSGYPVHPGDAGTADLQSTQVYTQVSIRKLKQIHSVTHPGAALEKKQPASASAELQDEAQRKAALLTALDAEAKPEEEE